VDKHCAPFLSVLGRKCLYFFLGPNTHSFLNRRTLWNRISSPPDLDPVTEQRVRHYYIGQMKEMLLDSYEEWTFLLNKAFNSIYYNTLPDFNAGTSTVHI